MFLIFSSAILLILLGALLLVAPSNYQAANRVLGGFSATFGVHLLLLSLRIESGSIEASPATGFLALSFGPLAFTYCSMMLHQGKPALGHWLKHGWPLIGMGLLQTEIIEFPALKDVMVLTSLFFYGLRCLWLTEFDTPHKFSRPTHLKQTVMLARALAVFLLILSFADVAIFYEITWLGRRNLTLAHLLVAISLAVVTLIVTFAGLARSPFFAWILSTKYEQAATNTGYTKSQIQEAITKLKQLVAHDRLFLEPDVNVEQFAEKLNIPTRLLSIAVNQCFGRTFPGYINDLRIAEAKQKLVSSTDTIAAIMLDVGFQTKSNFNRSFHAVTGMSPNSYRMKMRSEKETLPQ